MKITLQFAIRGGSVSMTPHFRSSLQQIGAAGRWQNNHLSSTNQILNPPEETPLQLSHQSHRFANALALLSIMAVLASTARRLELCICFHTFGLHYRSGGFFVNLLISLFIHLFVCFLVSFVYHSLAAVSLGGCRRFPEVTRKPILSQPWPVASEQWPGLPLPKTNHK